MNDPLLHSLLRATVVGHAESVAIRDTPDVRRSSALLITFYASPASQNAIRDVLSPRFSSWDTTHPYHSASQACSGDRPNELHGGTSFLLPLTGPPQAQAELIRDRLSSAFSVSYAFHGAPRLFRVESVQFGSMTVDFAAASPLQPCRGLTSVLLDDTQDKDASVLCVANAHLPWLQREDTSSDAVSEAPSHPPLIVVQCVDGAPLAWSSPSTVVIPAAVLRCFHALTARSNTDAASQDGLLTNLTVFVSRTHSQRYAMDRTPSPHWNKWMDAHSVLIVDALERLFASTAALMTNRGKPGPSAAEANRRVVLRGMAPQLSCLVASFNPQDRRFITQLLHCDDYGPSIAQALDQRLAVL